MKELGPATHQDSRVEDTAKAYEMARLSDVIRSAAADRRRGAAMIRDMVNVDMSEADIVQTTRDMSKNYGSKIVQYKGKPDELMPRGAAIADQEFHRSIGRNGGAVVSTERALYHLDGQANVLDKQAERDEQLASDRYDEENAA